MKLGVFLVVLLGLNSHFGASVVELNNKKINGRRDHNIAAVTLIKSKGAFEVLTVMTDFEVQK